MPMLSSILVREFKEKQTELFANSSNSSMPLLEFLIQHPNEESSYDENSLQLMSDLLKSNLSDFNSIEVQAQNWPSCFI